MRARKPGARDRLARVGGTVTAAVLAMMLLAAPSLAATATVSVVDGSFQPNATQIRLGDSVEWDFAATNKAQHTSTDNSGLGIWDSGAENPGSSSFSRSGSPGRSPITASSTRRWWRPCA